MSVQHFPARGATLAYALLQLALLSAAPTAADAGLGERAAATLRSVVEDLLVDLEITPSTETPPSMARTERAICVNPLYHGDIQGAVDIGLKTIYESSDVLKTEQGWQACCDACAAVDGMGAMRSFRRQTTPTP